MHYHWSDDTSYIKDIEFYAPHKKQEAMLYAPENADPAKLQALTDKIRMLGYIAEPDMDGEKYVLRVKKFPSVANVISVLEREGYTTGSHSRQRSAFDSEDAHKLKPQQMTGLLYMLGDSVLIASGAMRNGWLNNKTFLEAIKSGPGKKDITGSAKWLFAGSLLFFLGVKNPDKQAQYAYHDLAESMKKAGFNLTPEDEATLGALAEHKDGMLPKLERLVRENPLVINSLLQAAGGADNFSAGLTQENPWKAASGASTFLGHATALLTDETPKAEVEERKRLQEAGSGGEKEKNHRGLIERFNDWRHEKKYRVAGSASVFSSLLRIVSGFFEVKENKKKLADYGENAEAFLSAARAEGKGSSTILALAEDKVRTGGGGSVGEHGLLGEAEKIWATHTKDLNAQHAAKIEWGVNCVKAVANWYYALAGANVNADIKKLGVLDEICNSVAHMARHEPDKELRTVLMSSAAAMLSEQKGIDNPETEILGIIQKKYSALEHNPWEKSANPSILEQRRNPLTLTPDQTPASQNREDAPGAKVHHVASHEAVHGAEAQAQI